MRRMPRQSAFSGLVVLLLVLVNGCGRAPRDVPPDDEQIVLALKCARVGAAMDAPSPAGRVYVSGVLEADEGVRDALASLIAVRRGERLWPGDAAEWADLRAVRGRLDAFDALLGEAAGRRRQAALVRLRDAIEAVPEGLFESAQRQRLFTDAVWNALKWQHEDLRYLEAQLLALAAHHKVVYARALRQAADLDPEYAAAPPDVRAQEPLLDALYSLKLKLLTLREMDEARSAALASDAARLVGELRAERAALEEALGARGRTPEDVRQVAWIDALITYEAACAAHHEQKVQRLAEARRQEEQAFLDWVARRARAASP